MPFHDLCIAYNSDQAALSNTLLFAQELGYETVVLAVNVTGALQKEPPVIRVPTTPDLAGLRILRRLTLTISDTTQNHRLPSLTSNYDLVAVRPTCEKTLQHCCSSLECDLISLDFSQRLPCVIKFKTASSALQRGIRFEICYSVGIAGGSEARRNLISGATQLIRATRGRGIVISSDARNALGLRAPWDVINLAQVWGLSQQRAKEALCEEAGKVIRFAGMKRTSYRGVVDIIDGDAIVSTEGSKRKMQLGNEFEGIDSAEKTQTLETLPNAVKRKASTSSLNTVQPAGQLANEPMSKNKMKKQAKKARLEGSKAPIIATDDSLKILPV